MIYLTFDVPTHRLSPYVTPNLFCFWLCYTVRDLRNLF